jgi:hypothetical protein
MDESLLKLIEISQHQTEIVDKAWQYFSTVTLAVLGIVIGADRVRTTTALRYITLVGYVVFAVGNLLALLRAQTGAIRYITLLNRELCARNLDTIVQLYDPFPLWQLVVFHSAITLSVAMLIALSNRIHIAAKTVTP